jgi:hypothetical protein
MRRSSILSQLPGKRSERLIKIATVVLEILTVRLDKTMNELMAEALEDLFAKYDDK